MAKYIAQLIVAGSQVVGRAFAKALREEIQRSQQAAASRAGGAVGGDTSRAAAVTSRLGMTVQEAKQILNITSDVEMTEKAVQERFDQLFKMNDKANGGSFYLQSKVVRAKERLDEEMKHLAEKPQKSRRSRSSPEDAEK